VVTTSKARFGGGARWRNVGAKNRRSALSLQSRHLFTLFITLLERLLTMIGWFDLQIERRRSRLALLQLTDKQLKDIGLSRREIDGKIYQRSGIDHTDVQ
jgi:uncharacterized protein YjiS (DUF1127 family)